MSSVEPNSRYANGEIAVNLLHCARPAVPDPGEETEALLHQPASISSLSLSLNNPHTTSAPSLLTHQQLPSSTATEQLNLLHWQSWIQMQQADKWHRLPLPVKWGSMKVLP